LECGEPSNRDVRRADEALKAGEADGFMAGGKKQKTKTKTKNKLG